MVNQPNGESREDAVLGATLAASIPWARERRNRQVTSVPSPSAVQVVPEQQPNHSRPEVPQDLIDRLNAPLPEGAVEPHPTKAYLSTIKNIFVIERLNEVFGLNGWNYTSKIVENSGPMVVLKVTVWIPEYGIEREQYGGNDNSDRGDAYKGALTDALGKIAGYLGIGMYVYKGGGPTKTNPGRGKRPDPPVARPPAPIPPRPPRPIRTEAAQGVADRKIDGMRNGQPYNQVSAEEQARTRFFSGSTKDRLRLFAEIEAAIPPDMYAQMLHGYGVEAPSQFRSAKVAWECYWKLLGILVEQARLEADPTTYQHFVATEGGAA